MTSTTTRLFALALLLMSTTVAQAQDLAPELQFGARGVVSGNVNIASGQTTSAVSDFSDTALLVGARQKLFHDARGQLVIGFQFPDAESNLGQVFFHRVFVRLENQRNAFQIGRTRLSSTLVEFPTLRDDDALLFTDVVSPFSDGENSEDSQFGNVIEAMRFLTPRLRLELHGEHYTNDADDFSLNAAGLSLVYRVPESQRWNQKVLDQLGVSFDGFFTERAGFDGAWDEMLKNVKVAAVLNLYPDPVHFVQLSHQTIYNVGFDETRRVTSFGEMARARSVAMFTSLAYTWRKYEWPMLRASLGAGYKTFPDLTETNQLTLLGNVFYRLGANFDVGVQVQQTWNNGDLERLFEHRSTGFKLALIYSVDQRFNNQFDDRDSILNLEHGYVK